MRRSGFIGKWVACDQGKGGGGGGSPLPIVCLPVFVLVFIVHRRHQRSGRRQCLVDEDEDGLIGRQLDALSDDIDELAYGQIRGDEVFLLVNSSNVTLLDLLADYL